MTNCLIDGMIAVWICSYCRKHPLLRQDWSAFSPHESFSPAPYCRSRNIEEVFYFSVSKPYMNQIAESHLRIIKILDILNHQRLEVGIKAINTLE